MKIKSYLILTFFAFLLCVGKNYSQIDFCGLPSQSEQLEKKYPEIKAETVKFLNYQQAYIAAQGAMKKQTAVKKSGVAQYIIPVVFHIIHNYGTENISDAQVLDAVSILNRDYQRRNADTVNVDPEFKSLIADCQFEFRLAQLDPNGKCTNGIERIQSLQTYQGGDAAKINQWPREKYLNIWVVAAIPNPVSGTSAAGYAYLPPAVKGQSYPLDGVLLINSYIGSIGTGNVFQSRALTHEVGHFLGLNHTWGSTNQPGVACGDDGIKDTPLTKGYSQTCPSTLAAQAGVACTVGVLENEENYMEYSYCSKMFTHDQQVAMEATLNNPTSGRNNLWTPSNLALTGVDGSGPTECAPKADFYSARGVYSANSDYLCKGAPVSFYDLSTNGTPTSWNWSFSNATPSSATTQNVIGVTFNNPGWQTISLTVANGSGSDTKTYTQSLYITDQSTSQYSNNLVQGFENKSQFNSDWFINNQPVTTNNTSVWSITNTASFSGTNSIMLNSFLNPSGNYPFAGNAGDIDEFISPSIDLTGVSPLYLSYAYSYATRAYKSADAKETLKVFSSVNCGRTWTLLTNGGTISGPALANAGISASMPYVPTKNLWATKLITLPASLATSNVRFKFQFTSDDFSNNLFIDDINISSSVGIKENTEGVNSFSVFPNPTNESATILYELNKKQNVELCIYDMLGNKVLPLINQAQEAGEHSYVINKDNMAKGIYFIRLSVDGNHSAVQKFILLD